MAGKHKQHPVSFRPGVTPGDPEGDREWLAGYAKATGQSAGAVLSAALAEYRKRAEAAQRDGGG
jgi:hypothetical protein